MERWNKLDLLRKILAVLLLLGMLIGGVGMAQVSGQEGVLYGDEFLRREVVDWQGHACTAYAGKVNGEEVRYLITPEDAVIFTKGSRQTVYVLHPDPDYQPREETFRDMKGIEVRRDDTPIFRGGYALNGERLFVENGAGDWVIANGTILHGTKAEQEAARILRLVYAPERVQRGDGEGLLYCLLFGGMGLAAIFFADELFYFSIMFTVKDPEYAEPSDWELAGRMVGQICLTIGCFVGAVLAVTGTRLLI